MNKIKRLSGGKMTPEQLSRRFAKADKWSGIDDIDWADWRWQVRNSLRTPEEISNRFQLTKEHQKALRESEKYFLAAITPYYASLIKKSNDPIGLQAIPQKEELDFNEDEYKDPLNEEKYSPKKLIIHKYPDRLLLYASNLCATYCRHCTRKQRNFDQTIPPSEQDLENAIEYIRNKQEIRDVVISGGDPLLLEDSKLEWIIKEIRSINHVEIIRIGTRTIVTLPQRITQNLVSMLKNHNSMHSPIYVNTQFNHPSECTYESLIASQRLREACCILGNQMVLLKGVNDNVETVKELNHRLLMMGIRPYYIFQCDKNIGNTHLRTKLETGLDIIRRLDVWTSGLAVPQFIKDIECGGGKISLHPDNIIGKEGDTYLLRNYKGQVYRYKEV